MQGAPGPAKARTARRPTADCRRPAAAGAVPGPHQHAPPVDGADADPRGTPRAKGHPAHARRHAGGSAAAGSPRALRRADDLRQPQDADRRAGAGAGVVRRGRQGPDRAALRIGDVHGSRALHPAGRWGVQHARHRRLQCRDRHAGPPDHARTHALHHVGRDVRPQAPQPRRSHGPDGARGRQGSRAVHMGADAGQGQGLLHRVRPR